MAPTDAPRSRVIDASTTTKKQPRSAHYKPRTGSERRKHPEIRRGVRGEIRSLGLLHDKDEDVDMKHGDLLPTLKDNRPRGQGQKPVVH